MELIVRGPINVHIGMGSQQYKLRDEREVVMYRLSFKTMIVIISVAAIFQFGIRYKIIKVDAYDLMDDRLTLRVYAKPEESSAWRETRFKSLTQAKSYFEKTILAQETEGKKFLWEEVVPSEKE